MIGSDPKDADESRPPVPLPAFDLAALESNRLPVELTCVDFSWNQPDGRDHRATLFVADPEITPSVANQSSNLVHQVDCRPGQTWATVFGLKSGKTYHAYVTMYAVENEMQLMIYGPIAAAPSNVAEFVFP